MPGGGLESAQGIERDLAERHPDASIKSMSIAKLPSFAPPGNFQEACTESENGEAGLPIINNSMGWMLAGSLLLALAHAAEAAPFVMGVEHTPIVVADLEKAQSDFRAMGFAIKPGRFHADGIRNAHVKFPDGTELELITAPAPTDALTSEYYAKQQRGDGPVYFGLWARDHPALAVRIKALGASVEQDGGALTFPASDPLHHLFFGSGEKASTDRPEHFAHANSALRLSGFWVRGNAQERRLLAGLGVPMHHGPACGPLGAAEVVALPRGDVLFATTGPHDGALIGARVEVRSLDVAKTTMKKNGLNPKSYPGCASLWLPPSAAHGIWLEFVQAKS